MGQNAVEGKKIRTSNVQLRTSNFERKKLQAFTSMFDVGRSMFDVRILSSFDSPIVPRTPKHNSPRAI
jgi:hypothetical protein